MNTYITKSKKQKSKVVQYKKYCTNCLQKILLPLAAAWPPEGNRCHQLG